MYQVMRRKIRLIFKLLLLITAIYLAVTLVIGIFIYYIWPENYFSWFPAIPVFFWVMGVGLAFSLELTHTEKPDSVTMTYMIARGVKLILTAIFIGGYAFIVHTNLKQFGLTTLVFYMTFLILETYMFYLYEKRRTKRKRKNEPEPDSAPESEVRREKEIDIDA